MNYKTYNLKSYGDKRGYLTPLEQPDNVPFKIKRIFYIYGINKNSSRGCHANRKSKFFINVLSGSCKVLLDDGKKKISIHLNSPNQAIYFDRMIWMELSDFSENAIILVLSNQEYDESEYIRDYNIFKKLIQN